MFDDACCCEVWVESVECEDCVERTCCVVDVVVAECFAVEPVCGDDGWAGVRW